MVRQRTRIQRARRIPFHIAAAGLLAYTVTQTIPALYTGLLDTFKAEGCARGLAAAVEDYQGAFQPEDPTPEVAAAYAYEAVSALYFRAEHLDCPSSVVDDQQAFLEASRGWQSILRAVTRGQPTDAIPHIVDQRAHAFSSTLTDFMQAATAALPRRPSTPTRS